MAKMFFDTAYIFYNEDGSEYVEVSRFAKGTIVWGPYSNLTPGSYSINLNILPMDFRNGDDICCIIDIFDEYDAYMSVSRAMSIKEIITQDHIIKISFSLDEMRCMYLKVKVLGQSRLLIGHNSKVHGAEFD